MDQRIPRKQLSVVEMKRGRKPYAKDTERDSYDTTAVRKKLNALIAERQKQEKKI